MKKATLFILFCCIHFILPAQENGNDRQDYSKKTKGQLFEMYNKLNQKLEKDPQDHKSYYERSVLKYYMHDTTGAVSDMEKAVALDPRNSTYHYMYAYEIIDLGQYEQVIRSCETALKYEPDRKSVLILMGNALDKTEKHDEARSYYKQAIAVDDHYEDAYLRFAVSYVLTRDYEAAEGVITKLLLKNPSSAEGMHFMASIYMYEKKYAEAIKKAGEMIKAKQLVGQAYLLKSAAYDSLKNKMEACSAMLQAFIEGHNDGYDYIMKNCPAEQNNKLVKLNRLETEAYACQSRGDYNNALKLYNETVLLMPDSGICYYNRGKTKRLMNDHQGAVADYKIAIKKAPYFSTAYVALGVSYLFMDDVPSARQAFLKCTALNPFNEMAYYNLGDILRGEDKLQEAIPYYKQAIAIKPDYAKAYFWLGDSYAKLEMRTEACEALRTAEKLGDLKAKSQRIWYCK